MSSRFFLEGFVRGLLVKIDGQAKSLGNGGADVPGERHAVGHRDALDRNERHDVDGAEPWMFAAVLAQIDGLDRDLEERQDGRLDGGRVAGEREDRPVVRRVGGMVEQAHAWRVPEWPSPGAR